MFSPTVVRCFRTKGRSTSAQWRTKTTRRFSASSIPYAQAAPQQSPSSVFGSLTAELDRISPRFDVRADQIHIIRSPADFYDTLKAKISKAKRRVYLSTLYIGKTENELIHTIRDALRRNPELKVYLLTDALRGTRESPHPSCASLLAPLIADFGPERVQIRMFHTPNLTGLRKKLVPKRINEGWGLQHMKLYGVDDELILSGANLSNDYFTNRQDRYHIFSSKKVTDYFFRIYSGVAKISYDIQPDQSETGYSMLWPSQSACPSPLDDPAGYRAHASSILKPLIQPPQETAQSPTGDTIVYPLLQFTPLLKPEDTSTELPAILTIIRSLKPNGAVLPSSSPAPATSPASSDSSALYSLHNASWTFTAGYFNTPPFLRNLLLSTNPTRGTIIAASPWANGFYGSKGVSGMLPAAYTLLGKQFLFAIEKAGLQDRVKLTEWRRGTVNEPGGWTYHAKGLWVSLKGEDAQGSVEEKDLEAGIAKGPSLTIVGSSNYTKRSYELDLEANTLILTRNPDLQRRLGEEERWLQEYAKVVDKGEFERTERRVGFHVRLSMAIVSLLGGAL